MSESPVAYSDDTECLILVQKERKLTHGAPKIQGDDSSAQEGERRRVVNAGHG
jgi:hypothetical protein